MKCLDCQYDLSAITSNKCPECGRVFDKHDPMTFDAREPGWLGKIVDRFVFSIFAAASSCALLHIFVGYVALIAARFDLGRWPHRMGRDDPKFINGFVSAMHLGWLVLGLLAVFLLALSFVLIFVALFRLLRHNNQLSRQQRLQRLMFLAGTALIETCFVVHHNLDPAQISVWMLD